MKNKNLLEISNLSIAFNSDKVVKDISFTILPNEVLGIVGESGSGKSVTSLSIMKLIDNANYEGSILYHGINLLDQTTHQIRAIRGNEISMIFQEPMSSLNPTIKCGIQVKEILEQHTSLSNKETNAEVISLFEKVKLPEPETIYNKYPHEISGGQKQRVMIAMAIACKPRILIADEPTTALDVTVQKEIVALLKSIQQETEMSIIFISHDLSLISEIADRTIVMYKGEIVEQNRTDKIFNHPKHDYTKALIQSRPPLDYRLKRLPTIDHILEKKAPSEEITKEQREKAHHEIYSKAPLLEVLNVKKSFFSSTGLLSPKKELKALNDVSFKVYEGETLGLVGESGCGKSTLGNSILQLQELSDGEIKYRGKSILNLNRDDLRKLRKEIQIIFQDPYSSLNPRISVGRSIMEPMKVYQLHGDDKTRKQKTIELLERVGLSEEHFYRYPHEFSGGQRQRIGIARTIALEPKLIVCDESVSALDISVQAKVLNLLNELKEVFKFTYIFISHDLAVVKYMSDQLLVLNKGKKEELGDADEVYSNPQSEYTKKLIDAIPKGK
ncbi:MAG: ABC transporter ATP-binding protein [Flavobacteriaceae bacterium]|nr:ABC transporter ATP-binding protein [Flavobacteriaceae bacterium]